LGLLYYEGLGIPADLKQAENNFSQASQSGDPAADYQLALLDARKNAENTDKSLQYLTVSAQNAYPSAIRDYAILASSYGQPDFVIPCLKIAAAANDPIAQCLLAKRYEAGLDVDQNQAAADYWGHQAKLNGSYIWSQLDSIPGQYADQSKDLTVIKDLPQLKATEPEITQPAKLSEQGQVQVYDQLLSVDECLYLIESTAPWLRPSHTVHPQTGQAVHNELRTSYGCSFHPSQESLVVLAIKQRLSAHSDLPTANAEPFAMLRYRHGQEYREHYDFINPDSGEAGQEISKKGQRLATIFCYLNDVAEGGESHFPKLNYKVKPKQGRAVMFRNATDEVTPIFDSLHASLPVVEGEKWLATLWLRSKALDRY